MKSLEWLYGLEQREVELGLDRVSKVASLLGNPQDSFKSIHIGGTNGKGSTSKFIYTILREKGLNVGLYTSPHLVKFNERILINDKEISDEGLDKLVFEVKKVIESNNIKLTFFEITTLAAFMYFKDKVDYAVIEVGLGGRLDATNIITPLISVITKVSLEHQDYLGDTIEEIALEKAGIIKENIPVITSNKDEVLDIINAIAKEKSAELFFPDDVKIKESKLGLQKAKIGNYNIETKLNGEFQLENISLAVKVGEILKIDKKIIEKGIKKTYWPARLEIIKEKPLVILDCSHNEEGFRVLSEFISKLKGDITLVLGISIDKDKGKMISLVAEKVDKIILCKAEYRGTDTSELRQLIKHKNVFEIKKVKDAVDLAMKTENIVIITGSIYVAGEAMKNKSFK